MTTINLYGGALKSTLIERAFGMCGQSVTEFELTPEEYTLGLRCLNDTMAQFPDSTGYNMPPSGDGFAEEESGLAKADELGATALLAAEIAQNIGKAFSPNKAQARAISELNAKYLSMVSRELGRQTIRGAGNRWMRAGYGSPFFYTSVSEEEVVQ